MLSVAAAAGGSKHQADDIRAIVRAAALAAFDAGLSVLPPNGPGHRNAKSPLCDGVDAKGRPTWKHRQSERADRPTVEGWYGPGTSRIWVGIVTGACSGGLECLDFDSFASYEAIVATAHAIGLGELVERIESGYVEDTAGGGVHWLYYCDEVRGNTKLATRPGPPDPKTGKPTVETLIETRGEGGFVVVAPTTGLHPDGASYALRSGSFATIETLTSPERDALWTLAHSFHQEAKPAKADSNQGECGGFFFGGELIEDGPAPRVKKSTPLHGETLPGDEYEAEVTWDEVLEGWTRLFTTAAGVT
jgi:putative DNA primase/helicase